LFCSDIHHSKILIENFERSGIKAEHCDANTPDAERNEIQKE
jgi:superfamily II DNA or RNA helicase